MRSIAILTVVALLGTAAAAGESAADGHTVLDLERGSFRTFLRWKTAKLITKDAFVQKACEEKKVGADLAAQVAKLLDERARYYVRTRPGQPASWWSLESSAWQERDAQLFNLAEEVAWKLGK